MVKRGPFVGEPGLWSEMGRRTREPALDCLISSELSVSLWEHDLFCCQHIEVSCTGVTQLSFAHNWSVLKVKWPRLTMDGGAQGLSQG